MSFTVENVTKMHRRLKEEPKEISVEEWVKPGLLSLVKNEQQEQPTQETSFHAPESRILGADHRCG